MELGAGQNEAVTRSDDLCQAKSRKRLTHFRDFGRFMMDSPDYADEGSPNMDVSGNYRHGKLEEEDDDDDKVSENDRATGE